MRVFAGSAIAAVVAATACVSHAAEPSGKAIAVVQATNIDGASGQTVLLPEAPIFSGDKVITGASGEAQIRFRDNTKLVVGPNSEMVIDAFVFDPQGNARDFSISTVKGAFRFMSGNSRKDAYRVRTPTATIGVRGTEFDVTVEREGTTRVANIEGITRVCRRLSSGAEVDCQEAIDPCTLTVVRPSEQRVVRYSNDDEQFRNRQLEYHFRYIRNQSSLLRDFQVDLAQCRISSVIPGVPSNNTPGQAPQPGQPFEPPMPPPPTPPSVTLPSPPQPPGSSGSGRTTYDHGSVFRP
jgi:hypothetical protein